ncbi:MAG: reprolysin-like metallopeptidase, partial [Fimbriimonadales bacterium]
HGVLLDSNTGGGGQANRPDWAGCSNNWWTIAHELGHQFGLDHHAMGSDDVSPLYTSLMNYDYSYSLDGDGYKVHFSLGKFASLKLNESDLDEVLPYPEAEVRFLTKGPYHFQIKADGPSKTLIDWNRNTVFGEEHVRADINDGYGTNVGPLLEVGKAAGPPVLSTLGENLVVIYPVLHKEADLAKWTHAGLSPSRRGALVARIIENGKLGAPVMMVQGGVAGDAHAVEAFGKLFVAYPSPKGVVLDSFDRRLRRLGSVAHEGAQEPTLVRTSGPEQLWLFTRSEGKIQYRRIMPNLGSRTDLGLTSQTPAAAVWHPRIQRLLLAVTEPRGNVQGRIKILRLARSEDGWRIQHERWTTGPAGWVRTRARPSLVLDLSRDAGPYGQLRVYHKGDTADPAQPVATYNCRQIGDLSLHEGWWVKLLGNEWLLTRSAPSAAAYNGDIAYALRWFGGPNDHMVYLYLTASGISKGVLGDHDNVTFIASQGLKDSLARSR